MKFNDKEIAQLSEKKCDLEGRLNYSRAMFNQSACKERWFKLKANLLYYFRINDSGQIEHKQPFGVLVLENCRIQLEMQSALPFAFSIVFDDDWDRRHILSGRSEDFVMEWVNALNVASYEYWRKQLLSLQKRISLYTGKDPLFMIPRNEGCPMESSPKTNQSGFQCHISTAFSNSGNENHNSNWANFSDNPLIKFSPEPRQCNTQYNSNPVIILDNSWENLQNLNFDSCNKNRNVSGNKYSGGDIILKNDYASKQAPIGRFQPFVTLNDNSGTQQKDYLNPIPHPPRRSRSPKLLRRELLVNDLHRTLSDSRLNENKPMPPLRRKALAHADPNHGSKFYLSDDDDSDSSVTINPIYQSTSNIVIDFHKNADSDKKTEINLIDL